mgnify:CR=1 FL=1
MIATDTNKHWVSLDQQYYVPTYGRYPIALSHGKGAHVWDVEGKEYIDMLAGIAVNTLGHAHPELVQTISEQAARLMHISNFYVSKPQMLLAQKLAQLSGLSRTFFTNSGAESVEGALKFARRYAHSRGRGGEIISFEGCFHGRTLATIATGKAQMQQGFDPIPGGFTQIPFNDIEAFKKAISQNTAAVILEPIQGEGGINPTDGQFSRALRQICTEQDIVLICDEVQAGIARTGKIFAKEHNQVQPDIITLAKGLGGGFPIGAIITNSAVSDALQPGDHGTTYGGNPLACAVALKVLEIIERDNLLAAVQEKGAWLRARLEKLAPQHITRVKGAGLMIGVEFKQETKPLVAHLLQKGVLANATAGNILRLVPPLNIEQADLEKVLVILEESIAEVYGG